MPRPHPSNTIPRSFHFHYRDGQPPKTPEPEDFPRREAFEPPSAPRQPLRRTTRRLGLPSFSPPIARAASHDVPLPTIEQPPAPEVVPMVGMQYSHAPNLHFLAPQPFGSRIFSPPKTPMPQEQSIDYFDTKSTGESISRPSTACSTFSDSSISSQESMESFPSFGASSASPESESQDPFTSKATSSQESLVSSPLMSYQGPPTKSIKAVKKTVWTEEMDSHLWSTFLTYLRDPSHTPFKLFPGSHPPLGVCSRVANDAKRTWKTNRGMVERQLRMRAGSPDSVRSFGSGESTPTGLESRKPTQQWPRNSSTRRRLRTLCKRNPTLSAHYQRLMQNRSPSPFESSNSSGRNRAHTSPFVRRSSRGVFSTRDMNISLVATTSSAMQTGNPLSELATDATLAQPQLPVGMSDRPISRSGAHQRSHSLQLGIESSVPPSSDFRGLASPFNPQFQHGATWHARQRPAASQVSSEAMDLSPRLEPPAELHAPLPMSKSLKKRARLHLDDGTGGEGRENLLKDLFGAPADSSHRRVRSRGFSLGDMNEGARRLSSIFTPPSMDEVVKSSSPAAFPYVPHTQTTSSSHTAAGSMLAPPVPDVPPRLGSPFAPHKQEKQFNTIPRNFKVHLDPAATFEPSTSFEDRLGAVALGRISKMSGSKSLGRSFARNNPNLGRLLRDQDHD